MVELQNAPRKYPGAFLGIDVSTGRAGNGQVCVGAGVLRFVPLTRPRTVVIPSQAA